MKTRRCLMITLLALLGSAAVAASAADGGAYVDPLLRNLSVARQAKSADEAGFDIRRLIAVEETADPADPTIVVILRLSGTVADLSGVPGLAVGSTHLSAGRSIATARLPLSSLPALAAVEGVDRIEASRLQRPLLDVAVPAGRVDQVWTGAPAYTGDGVLVGIVDTGIDWRHEDFRNADGSTRILAIWDLYGTGTPPAGFSFGAEYDAADIEAGDVEQYDYAGHGTHVAGIAAGNGRTSSGVYRGAAWESRIVFAKAYSDALGGFDEARTIDAINYLAAKAAALDLPIAINLSLGGHFGAHDGTTAQEQLIDDLSGAGVVFCIAAGNEGESYVHDSASAAGGTVTLTIDRYYTPNSGAGDDYVVLETWVEAATSVLVTTPGGTTCGPVAVGNGSAVCNTAEGVIEVDNASGVDPNNGDRSIMVFLYDRTGTELAGGDWTIRYLNGTGTAHVWQANASMATGFLDGDQSYSVGSPATAAEAIAVAAWKTRNQWPSVGGTAAYSSTWGAVAIGDRAPFSSIGPTRDGREKPDVIAPGMAIISCYSQDTTPAADPLWRIAGGGYLANQGTSMASPFVCGTAALLLEKNPSLTAAEIKAALRASARSDAYTGTTWNAEFGAGKIDAAAALAAVVSGGNTPAGDLDLDGETTVLDVMLLVNHILDPTGHPLSAEAAAQANVVDDAVIDVLDLVRVVAYVLGTAAPGKGAAAPASLVLAEPCFADGGWWQEIELRGDGLAGAQFALRSSAGGWSPDELEAVDASDVRVAARAAGADGEQLRVLVYDLDNALPTGGVRLRVPLAGNAATAPVVTVAGMRAADASGSPLEIRLERPALIAGLELGVRPNPARAGTSVRFRAPLGESYSLAVYDLRGRRVRELGQGSGDGLDGELAWDGRDASGAELASGVYFVQMESAAQVLTRKVILAR